MESTLLFPFFSGSELTDEIKSFLFTLEHHVLLGSTSDESLKKDNGSLLLILFVVLLILDGVVSLSIHEIVVTWSWRSDLNLVDSSNFFFLILFLLLLNKLIIN
jgi:hypothetical protein